MPLSVRSLSVNVAAWAALASTKTCLSLAGPPAAACLDGNVLERDDACGFRQGFEAVALLQRSVGTSKAKRNTLQVVGHAGQNEEAASSQRPQAELSPEFDSSLADARQAVALAAEEVLLHAMPRHRVQNLDSVAVEVQYSGLLEELLTFPQRRPWAFNVIMATAKTASADILVQAGDRQRAAGQGINWRRALFFAIFGCVYVGMVQWFFYVNLFSMLCPDALTFANLPLASKLTDKEGQLDLVLQVIVDQLLITPFIYFPTFYVVKEVFFGTLHPYSSVWTAMSTYKQNFVQDNLASMSLWFPADFVIFTVPMYLRMPLDHLVAFGWTMVISHMRGGSVVPTSTSAAK